MTEDTTRYVLTPAQLTAGLRRLATVAEQHAAGTLTTAQAQHQLQRVIAPVRRRARRGARLLAGSNHA